MCRWAALEFARFESVMVGWDYVREVLAAAAKAFAARPDVRRIALTPEVSAYVGPNDREAIIVTEVAVPTEGLYLLGFSLPVPYLAVGAMRCTARTELIEVSPGLACSRGS